MSIGTMEVGHRMHPGTEFHFFSFESLWERLLDSYLRALLPESDPAAAFTGMDQKRGKS